MCQWHTLRERRQCADASDLANVFDQLATKHPGQQRAATVAPHRVAQLTRQATADVRESDGGSARAKGGHIGSARRRAHRCKQARGQQRGGRSGQRARGEPRQHASKTTRRRAAHGGERGAQWEQRGSITHACTAHKLASQRFERAASSQKHEKRGRGKGFVAQLLGLAHIFFTFGSSITYSLKSLTQQRPYAIDAVGRFAQSRASKCGGQ